MIEINLQVEVIKLSPTDTVNEGPSGHSKSDAADTGKQHSAHCGWVEIPVHYVL